MTVGVLERATEKQEAFIAKLVGERDLSPDQEAAVTVELDKKTASRVIDGLLKLPFKEGAAVVTGLDLSKVPTGRYAVPGDETRLKIKIQNVGKGKWAGWVFVKNGSQYHEEERFGIQRPGQAYAGQKVGHLEKIVADPVAAMRKYGEITGTCGNCGLPLENEDSVAFGIGPVCRKKLGW